MFSAHPGSQQLMDRNRLQEEGTTVGSAFCRGGVVVPRHSLTRVVFPRFPIVVYPVQFHGTGSESNMSISRDRVWSGFSDAARQPCCFFLTISTIPPARSPPSSGRTSTQCLNKLGRRVCPRFSADLIITNINVNLTVCRTSDPPPRT